MKRACLAILTVAFVFAAFAGGCAAPDAQTAGGTQTPAPAGTPATTSMTVPVAAVTPTATAAPTATPKPTPAYATIGAIGDIMSPETVLNAAWNDGDRQDYNYDEIFRPMRVLTESVDLMCGNLESAMAGEEATYSHGNTGERIYTFNAPDALARDLKEIGLDVLTTANNHCCDRYLDGMIRTAERLRELGFIQTGTYLDEADRQRPCIVEVNGISVGIVAATMTVNLSKWRLTDEEQKVNVSILQDEAGELTQQVLDDIRRTREAGAEFIIAFIHWDQETDDPVMAVTKRQGQALLEAGADCILGSHPHRIKACEYVTVERDGVPYTGLVVYSMGNFLCTQGREQSLNLFVRLTLKKDADGQVTLEGAEYMPTVCYTQNVDGVKKYQIIPALQDVSLLTDTRFGDALPQGIVSGIEYARNLCDRRLKINQVITPMEEACWKN